MDPRDEREMALVQRIAARLQIMAAQLEAEDLRALGRAYYHPELDRALSALVDVCSELPHGPLTRAAVTKWNRPPIEVVAEGLKTTYGTICRDGNSAEDALRIVKSCCESTLKELEGWVEREGRDPFGLGGGRAGQA